MLCYIEQEDSKTSVAAARCLLWLIAPSTKTGQAWLQRGTSHCVGETCLTYQVFELCHRFLLGRQQYDTFTWARELRATVQV